MKGLLKQIIGKIGNFLGEQFERHPIISITAIFAAIIFLIMGLLWLNSNYSKEFAVVVIVKKEPFLVDRETTIEAGDVDITIPYQVAINTIVAKFEDGETERFETTCDLFQGNDCRDTWSQLEVDKRYLVMINNGFDFRNILRVVESKGDASW